MVDSTVVEIIKVAVGKKAYMGKCGVLSRLEGLVNHFFTTLLAAKGVKVNGRQVPA